LSGISENAIVGFFFFWHVYVGISIDYLRTHENIVVLAY
jgi:hypothetical protein